MRGSACSLSSFSYIGRRFRQYFDTPCLALRSMVSYGPMKNQWRLSPSFIALSTASTSQTPSSTSWTALCRSFSAGCLGRGSRHACLRAARLCLCHGLVSAWTICWRACTGLTTRVSPMWGLHWTFSGNRTMSDLTGASAAGRGVRYASKKGRSGRTPGSFTEEKPGS